jgi:Kef-type K+ transport system membrane component KefB
MSGAWSDLTLGELSASAASLLPPWLHPHSGIAPSAYGYVLILLALFVLPQVLGRALRLPQPLGALGLGALCGMGLGLFGHDETIHLLALLGIAGLFCGAGLEVDPAELRPHRRAILAHALAYLVLTATVGFLFMVWHELPWEAAALAALAVTTPSTGFILSRLKRFDLSDAARSELRTQAIGTEIIALAALVVVVNVSDWQQLLKAVVVLGALLLLLPRLLHRMVRHTGADPTLGFAVLLLVAVIAALATRSIGGYYLLGAFVTGVLAARIRRRDPELLPDQVLHAVELFATFFMPCYFFSAGLGLHAGQFTIDGLWLGAGLVALVLPMRVLLNAVARRTVAGNDWRAHARISSGLLPTLVFTLVLAQLLAERHPDVVRAHPGLMGALIISALVSSIAPGLLLGTRPGGQTTTVVMPPH